MIESVSISSDSSYIAAGSDDARVYLFFRDNSGTPTWYYDIGDFVLSVSISSNGSYIAAGGADASVYFFFRDNSGTPTWDYATGDAVSSVSVSSDGSYIAAGSVDQKVYLFSKNSSTPLWSYTTGNIVNSVSISSDGSYIAAGSIDQKVYLFSRTDNNPIWSYNAGSSINSVSISSDGIYIAAGSSGGNVYLFRRLLPTPEEEEKPAATTITSGPGFVLVKNAVPGTPVKLSGAGVSISAVVVVSASEVRVTTSEVNRNEVSLPPQAINSEVLSAVNVSMSVSGALGSMTLTIDVGDSDILSRNVDPNTLAIWRLSGGVWFKLDTRVTRTSGGYRLSSSPSGFSVFAVIGERYLTSNLPPEDTREREQWEQVLFISAVAALIVAIMLLIKPLVRREGKMPQGKAKRGK